MENTLFLQSEVHNPYEIYMRRLAVSPVLHDTQNNIVAVHSYDICKQILGDTNAAIPPTPQDNELNEKARLIKDHLARRLNPPAHIYARKAAMEIFSNMKPVSISDIMGYLMKDKKEIEWVESVCKKLPVLYLLKSFQFNEEACHFFLQHMESLTKIMLSQRTVDQANAINQIAPEIYELIEKKYPLPFYVSNLAGLLIQSYDACRGLLSNALLQILSNHSIAMKDKSFFSAAVTETLRFDPPVHNTLRVKNGQSILLVLAAANRDPAIFHEPNTWNIERKNNHIHLSFGSGHHSCPANQLAVNMAAETLHFLFSKFSKIELVPQSISYEPLVNLRLPCSVRLRLGN